MKSGHSCPSASEDDVWDEDSAYVEMLANESARLREKSAKQANGEEISDDEEEDDIEEELGYISPLDNVDPYITFKQALTSMFLFGALEE